MATDSNRRNDFKSAIRNLTPAWFASVMGTGAISVLFHAFPYGKDSQAMNILCIAVFILNLVMFVSLTLASIARYLLYPDVWSLMIQHPVQSMYIGTFPMALTTLLNIGVVLEEKYDFGQNFMYMIWSFWILDVIMSVICVSGLLHIMATQQRHALEQMTTVWLLPVVTLIVASSTGGVIAPALQKYSLSHALLTITTSVVCLTIGITLALMLLVIYMLRSVVYGNGLPPGVNILSSFLPLGPTGQAGYSVLLIGQYAQKSLPLFNQPMGPFFFQYKDTGDIIGVVSIGIALCLWSLATFYALSALISIQHVLRRERFPFKVTFWGLIFPNGVYANLSIALASTFNSDFFRIFGAIWAILTLLLWFYVASRTVMLMKGWSIFEAPCLTEIDLGATTATSANGVNSGAVKK